MAANGAHNQSVSQQDAAEKKPKSVQFEFYSPYCNFLMISLCDNSAASLLCAAVGSVMLVLMSLLWHDKRHDMPAGASRRVNSRRLSTRSSHGDCQLGVHITFLSFSICCL
ncbi:hypothetical protein L484_004065 [Morus notabilis]|uniref:Uncharacterized protein n=1 Tax=Morus notabilis TaxID=981085 RepID=W9QHJ2_9ROSA|nr:hypothetical protein L484_004065 [Morus notabilis]